MKHKGLILIFSTAVISGFSIFLNQYGAKMSNPYIFTGTKNIIVALLLTGVILAFTQFREFKKLTPKHWLQLSAIGLIGGSIPFLMFFKGLSLTSGPVAANLHKFLFVFVLLLAPIFLKEKVKWSYLLGFIPLFFGSLLLFKIDSFPILDQGMMLILGASLLWAVENILAKKVLSQLSGRLVAWGRMTFGSLFIILFWLATGQAQQLLQLSSSQWGWTILTAVLLFGYVFTWYSGLKYVPLTQAAAILALGAPLTSLLQLIQGQPQTALQLQGIILMFAGVIYLIKFLPKCSPYKTPLATP